MLYPLLESLDMTVKHRAGAPATHVVPGAVNVEPFLGALFAAANFVAHLGIEYFGAAAGKGAEAGVFQNRESLRDGKLEDPLGEVPDLDSGECLDDDVRIERPEAPKQFKIPI